MNDAGELQALRRDHQQLMEKIRTAENTLKKRTALCWILGVLVLFNLIPVLIGVRTQENMREWTAFCEAIFDGYARDDGVRGTVLPQDCKRYAAMFLEDQERQGTENNDR